MIPKVYSSCTTVWAAKSGAPTGLLVWRDTELRHRNSYFVELQTVRHEYALHLAITWRSGAPPSRPISTEMVEPKMAVFTPRIRGSAVTYLDVVRDLS